MDRRTDGRLAGRNDRQQYPSGRWRLRVKSWCIKCLAPIAQMVEHLAWIWRLTVQVPPGLRHFLKNTPLSVKNAPIETTDQIPWRFPDFDSKLQNSLTCNKIPWLFPDSEKDWHFPDFSLTVATLKLSSESTEMKDGLCSYSGGLFTLVKKTDIDEIWILS